ASRQENSATTLAPQFALWAGFPSPWVYVKPNVVERALTVLSVLELAIRTRFFDFKRKELPIEVDLIRNFAESKFLWLQPYAAAAEFVARYTPDGDRTQRSEPVNFEDFENVSYGDICGFIELAEYFINNDSIHRFIVGLEHPWFSIVTLMQLLGAAGN